MTTSADKHKIIIGRTEPLDFVELSLNKVPAKIDTGAYRSAIHAENIKLSEDGKTLSCEILANHPFANGLSEKVTTDEFRTVNIANSFGDEETRYEIKLKIKLGPKIFRTPFSLADRSKKTYPILVGRKALNERFIIDTARSGIDRSELKQLYNIDLPQDEDRENKKD